VGVGWGGQGQRYGRNGCARECASTLQPLGLLRVCSGFISRVKTDGVPHMFVMTVLFALCQLAPTPAMCCHPVCCRQPQAILGVHPTWQRTVMFEFPRIRFQHTPVTKTQQRALLEAGGGGRGGGGGAGTRGRRGGLCGQQYNCTACRLHGMHLYGHVMLSRARP
jgi:hypothetical protein